MGRQIRCSAPGRAGIIGNPSDMYGGSVISCSIQERATVTIEEADALIIESNGDKRVIRSKQDLEIENGYFGMIVETSEILFDLEWKPGMVNYVNWEEN